MGRRSCARAARRAKRGDARGERATTLLDCREVDVVYTTRWHDDRRDQPSRPGLASAEFFATVPGDSGADGR
jgi:hypothetical protein